MAPPHETFFFLTGGTGPRPTSAAFFAAAAQRTAKTKEERRKCEERKEKMRARQMQREAVLKEVDGVGVGVGVMRLLGLRRVGEKGVRKGQGIEGGQAGKNGEASSGGGGAGKDAGGTSKEESAKDAASSKEPEKEAVENDIVQSAGYEAGILSHGETHAVAHQGTPHINCNNASGDGHISVGESPHTQDREVGMLLDADEVIASTTGLLDSDKPDGEKDATVHDRENVAENGTHTSPSQKVQSIHQSVHSHIPNTPPVLPVGLEVDSDINPNDIRPPILVPAPDPDDNLDRGHDDEWAPLNGLLKNMLLGFESDINPDDIRPPILVPAPDPDDSSEPIPQNNAQPGLESDINPDDIRPPILVPAPDPDDSAEGGISKGMPAGLETDASPTDIRPPIITLTPDPDDNFNDSHHRPPELSPNLSASLEPQDAELDVKIRRDVRDPFSPTPHLPPPWEAANIPYPHDGKNPFSPTPHLSRPWERPNEMFQSIRSSPPPELDLITPSERRFKISHDAKDLLLITSRPPSPRESIHRQPSAERGTPNLQNAEDPFSPTPHLPPPWEAPFHHTEFSRPISASSSPHPRLPTPSPVSVEVGQRITPSPHLDLPTPSFFFLHEASSRPTSRPSSVRNSIIGQCPVSLPTYEYNTTDAYLVPLPASREPYMAESTRSSSAHTPLNNGDGYSIDDGKMRLLSCMEDVSHRVLTSKSGYDDNDMGKHVGGPAEQVISQPLPSKKRAQQTVKWVRGGGGWGGDWVRVMK